MRLPRLSATVAVVVFLSITLNAVEEEAPFRIAFGSCLDQDIPHHIWDAVLARKPNVFIFAGDNVYADTQKAETFRAAYKHLGDDPGYQALQASCSVLATWDDHDYGANDAGVEFPGKEVSKQTFLDFFAIPDDDPMRSRPGIYHARWFVHGELRIQIILLDTRTFRESWTKRINLPGQTPPYRIDPESDSTILGEAQWSWLSEQLGEPADLSILVSSIQVLSGQHGWESWALLPKEQDRLFKLLDSSSARQIIILSGDRHHAELSVSHEATSLPLYDLTSSSMNRPRPLTDEPNRYRRGPMLFDRNFGLLSVSRTSPEAIELRMEIVREDGATLLDQSMEIPTP